MTKTVAVVVLAFAIVASLAVANGVTNPPPTIQDDGVALPFVNGINMTGSGISCSGLPRGANCTVTLDRSQGAFGEIQHGIDGGGYAGAKAAKVDVNGYPNFGNLAVSSSFIGDGGQLSMFGRQIAGKMTMATQQWGNPNIPLAWQDGQSTVYTATTSATAVLGTLSNVGQAANLSLGTGSEITVSVGTTSSQALAKRNAYSTGTTLNTTVDLYGERIAWRGNDAGMGGFFCSWDFYLSFDGGWNANSQGFVGLSEKTTALSGYDSGYQYTSGTLGAWYVLGIWALCGNDDAGTSTCVTSCNSAFDAGAESNGYRFSVYAPPAGSSAYLELRRIDTAGRNNDTFVCSGTVTSDIPGQTSFLVPHISVHNGPTALPVTLNFMKQYCQVPY